MLFATLAMGQKKPLPKPKPKDPWANPIKNDPYLPPFVLNNCEVDFAVLPIKFTRLSPGKVAFEVFIRNHGTGNYQKKMGASSPIIVAYTWSPSTTVQQISFDKLDSGKTIKFQGEMSWPTNNEFLPPLTVEIRQDPEFDMPKDCERSNNLKTVTGEEIKAIIR